MKRNLLLFAMVAMALAVAAPTVAFATTDVDTPVVRQGDPMQQEHAVPASDRTGAVGYGLAALAAAFAVGLCALGTGYAQGKIGTAGGGALAERPELSGTMIILVAIPETAVILGFVIAISMLGKL